MQHAAAAPGDKIDALLAAFSAGTLTPAMHALIASHLAMSRRNRGFVAVLDHIQGGQLDKSAAMPLPNRDARLAAIFNREPAGMAPARPEGFFPAPLRQFIGRDLAVIKWRTRLPGLREHRIASEAQGEASLYWIKGGRKMPFHTHAGSEATLVLQGAFHDASGYYQRGDVAVADADVDHQPVADGDCLCFAVTDAPLRLTGPLGRIVERLLGHRH